MIFDLWFPKETETAWGESAYVEVVNPFDDGSGSHDLVKSKGHILLLEEAVSADECCQQIDRLIADLQKLKAKARKKFAK